jgi:hypothetical protein
VFFETGRDRATAHVSRSAGSKAKNHRDRLALVEWGLSYHRGREANTGHGEHGHK